MSSASWLDIPMIRTRPDLEVVERRGAMRRWWVVKDPVALEYFQFAEAEWFILDCFSRGMVPREIIQQYNRRFAPETITEQEIQAFVGRAQTDGLLLVDRGMGFGSWLYNKSQADRRREWLAKPFQILCLRFRGVDPSPVLGALAPIGWILFSPVFVVLLCLMTVLSALLFFSEFETILVRFPQIQTILSGENILLLLAALSIVKVLHELGHGLACQRFGGEVHELGFMLLAFAPCLYCNVSDAWMNRSRWKRIVVSLGGIYVEWILATLCFFLWFFSEPGTFNSLCLNIVLVCSVSTLLVNGNPLLRYDGYYVLSDWWEQPNLATKSRQAFWGLIRSCFVGSRRVVRDLSSRDWPLAVYALLAMIYRVFIIGVILWFVHRALAGVEMEFLFYIVAGLVLSGLAIPVLGSLRTVSTAGRQRPRIRWFRSLVSLGFIGVLVVILSVVPFNYRVAAPVLVEPTTSSNVYTDISGRLLWAEDPGTEVQAGDVVARLDNPRVVFRRQELADEIREQELILENLQKRANLDSDVTFQIPVVQATLDDLQRQLERAEKDIERLTVRAETGGTLFAGPPRDANAEEEQALGTWSGSPLDRSNLNCWLERGDVIGIIANPRQMRAVLYVTQSEIELVRPEQPVRLAFNHRPEQVLDGQVALITQENVEALPDTILSDSDLVFETDRFGRRVPMETIYRVVVRVDYGQESILPGSGGRGKIMVDRQTIASRLWRWLRKTFTFEW